MTWQNPAGVIRPATGGTGRASGWACDVRKRHPYAMYGKINFREIVHTEGDCFARYMVRMEEILESMNIIEQLIDNIPEGNYQEKMKPIIRVPEGNYYAAVEGSRGEFGVYLESHGDKFPYRMKFRATGLPLVSAMETMCRNAKIADLIAIGGTVDYVAPYLLTRKLIPLMEKGSRIVNMVSCTYAIGRLRHWCSSRYLRIPPLHREFRLPLHYSRKTVLKAVHGLSP